MSAVIVTLSHDVIRQWILMHNGVPALYRNAGGEEVLRIDFPDVREPELTEISWEEFFRKFEEDNLAFLVHEEESRFYKFVRRDAAERKTSATAQATRQTKRTGALPVEVKPGQASPKK